MHAVLLPCIAVALLAGCTSRGALEGMRTSARNACAERPPSQYQDCMEAADASWEDYQREREALRDERSGPR